jgi:hypothetical protein
MAGAQVTAVLDGQDGLDASQLTRAERVAMRADSTVAELKPVVWPLT